jgi:ATP-dependent helicase/nuclease subunit A
VVFVVNLARGTANRRDPIRISALEPEDAFSVAVGDYLSDADEDDGARQKEETKRLLYVALTRARDRLYLATALKEGRIQPGRGSLAEVLPATFLELFAARSVEVAQLEWRASSGKVHSIAVLAGREMDTGHGDRWRAGLYGPPDRPGSSDFEPLVDTAPPRTPIAELLPNEGPLPGGRESDRLIGTLVHRLLERFGLDPAVPPDRAAASRVLRLGEVDGPWVDDALAGYQAIANRPDVREVYRSGDRLHEVPFTMRVGENIVRGTIDCLVRTAPNRMTVLEFKTGRPRPEHQVQLDLYRRAAQQVFRDATVEAQLIYTDRRAT